jgi:hypothetical protein
MGGARRDWQIKSAAVFLLRHWMEDVRTNPWLAKRKAPPIPLAMRDPEVLRRDFDLPLVAAYFFYYAAGPTNLNPLSLAEDHDRQAWPGRLFRGISRC